MSKISRIPRPDFLVSCYCSFTPPTSPASGIHTWYFSTDTESSQETISQSFNCFGFFSLTEATSYSISPRVSLRQVNHVSSLFPLSRIGRTLKDTRKTFKSASPETIIPPMKGGVLKWVCQTFTWCQNWSCWFVTQGQNTPRNSHLQRVKRSNSIIHLKEYICKRKSILN